MYEVVVRHRDSCRVIARAHYGAHRIAAREADAWLASVDTTRGSAPIRVSMVKHDGRGGRDTLGSFTAHYSPSRAKAWR